MTPAGAENRACVSGVLAECPFLLARNSENIGALAVAGTDDGHQNATCQEALPLILSHPGVPSNDDGARKVIDLIGHRRKMKTNFGLSRSRRWRKPGLCAKEDVTTQNR